MHRLARPVASGLIALGGVIHLDLWQDGYRAVPRVGLLFLVNVVASIAVAVALLASRRRWPVAAGIGLSAGSLVALVLSRTVGIFGFIEAVWTPIAIRALVVEAAALVALVVAAAGAWRNRIPLPVPAPLPLGGK